MNSTDSLREFVPDFENVCRDSELTSRYSNFNPYIMTNNKMLEEDEEKNSQKNWKKLICRKTIRLANFV